MVTYLLISASFPCTPASSSFELRDAAEDFRQVERLGRDAVGFEQFLAVADGVEGGRPRADAADAQVAHAVDDAADGREPGQIVAEVIRVRADRVQLVSE